MLEILECKNCGRSYNDWEKIEEPNIYKCPYCETVYKIPKDNPTNQNLTIISEAGQLDTFTFQGTYISQNVLPKDKTLTVVQQWIKNQFVYWPVELTPSILTSKLELKYLSYWIIGGQAEADWGAKIIHYFNEPDYCTKCNGKRKQKTEKGEEDCDQCDGRGTIIVKTAKSSSQVGHTTIPIKKHIIENFDSKQIKLYCGEPSFSSITKPHNGEQKLKAVLGLYKNKKDILTKIRGEISTLLEEKVYTLDIGDKIEEVYLWNIRIHELQYRLLFYPIYFGTYVYKDEKGLVVQVDGITGKLYVQVPFSVRLVQFLYVVISALVILSITILAIMLANFIASLM